MQLNLPLLLAGLLAMAPIGTLANSKGVGSVCTRGINCQTEGAMGDIRPCNGAVCSREMAASIATDAVLAVSRVKRSIVGLDKRAGPCGQAPSGVPQNVFDNCCNALKGKRIHVKNINIGKAVDDIQVTKIPYACISAAPWFDGLPNTISPYACGDDCLRWTGLTRQQYINAQAVWKSLKA